MTTARPKTKMAIVVDRQLPPGLAANAAAVLAMTIGHRLGDQIVGQDLTDANDGIHLGITGTPIPILTANADQLRQIRSDASTLDNQMMVVDFTDCAQQARRYDEYATTLGQTAEEELTYLAVALHGPHKQIQSLTGSLPLLR